MKHKHHIVPKHMGGTDEPSNLMEVTTEEHAELHLSLYLEHGRWQDWVASQGLAGIIGHEEAVRQAIAAGNPKALANRRSYDGESNPFFGKTHTTETRQKLRESTLKQIKEKGHPGLGKNITDETRQKMRDNNRGLGNPNHGKKHSPETISKMKEKRRLWWEKKRQQQTEA